MKLLGATFEDCLPSVFMPLVHLSLESYLGCKLPSDTCHATNWEDFLLGSDISTFHLRGFWKKWQNKLELIIF